MNGVQTTLREPDGIHFSFAGEDVLATYVIREVALIYLRRARTDLAFGDHELGVSWLARGVIAKLPRDNQLVTTKCATTRLRGP